MFASPSRVGTSGKDCRRRRRVGCVDFGRRGRSSVCEASARARSIFSRWKNRWWVISSLLPFVRIPFSLSHAGYVDRYICAGSRHIASCRRSVEFVPYIFLRSHLLHRLIFHCIDIHIYSSLTTTIQPIFFSSIIRNHCIPLIKNMCMCLISM